MRIVDAETRGSDVLELAAVLSAPSHVSSDEEISQLLVRQYGIRASLAKLGSERDENYRITLADGTERLLKVSHILEDRLIIEFQTEALRHMAAAAPELPVPRLVPALSGAFESTALGSDGQSRQARLFTYLPGAPSSSFPRNSAQAAALGLVAARLDAALADFEHPGARHEFLWDIRHASRTRALLAHTPSSADRALCESSIERFERRLAQEIDGFRAQVIHNDLNPHNLLVNPANPDEFTGIIDFGDMVHAPLINEVAVACAYLLTVSPEPLGTVPEFAAAYHSVTPLDARELVALPQLIALRHAITILITNWRAARYPENRDYILRNQQHALAGLRKLSSLPEHAAHARLLDACPTVRP